MLTWLDQAIGVQHHILAELFLISFDPKLPRIGGQRKEAAKRTNVSEAGGAEVAAKSPSIDSTRFKLECWLTHAYPDRTVPKSL